jgi:transcriptional regulator with XRE-family HTH domain
MENRLGEYIKKYRLEHGLSLREFAEKVGISHTHVDSIEKGIDFRTGKHVRLTNETIQKIASVLNKDPAKIFLLSVNKISSDTSEIPLPDNDDPNKIMFSNENNPLNGLSKENREKALEYIKMLKVIDEVNNSKNMTIDKDAK